MTALVPQNPSAGSRLTIEGGEQNDGVSLHCDILDSQHGPVGAQRVKGGRRMENLEGRVAIVTGAASGIGRAMAGTILS